MRNCTPYVSNAFGQYLCMQRVLTGSLLLFLSLAARSLPLTTFTFSIKTAALCSGMPFPLPPLLTLLDEGLGLPLLLGALLGGLL